MANNLSEHFTLDELTISQEGERRGLDNTPNPAVIANLTRLAVVLEQVRALLGGKAMHINSGYRSPAVNAAVGGVPTSAHVDGLAADFTAGTFGSCLEVAKAIEGSGIKYDQLIYEHTWVHLGLARPGKPDRNEKLTLAGDGHYLKGIVPKPA
jgi:zinc D-Ala-D-Ala carboxypeptidase